MRPLAAEELLEIWERGRDTPPWQQALLLLTAAFSEHTAEALERLSIGRRDGLLMKLREWTFGSRLACVVQCPACGERLEFTIRSEEIQTGPHEIPETIDFISEDYRTTFRLPSTADLAALYDLQDTEAARNALLAACLVEASLVSEADASDGEMPISVQQFPSETLDAVAQRMRDADPLADIQIALACPVCDHRWVDSFDIVSFFWQEIEDWAWRTLREIHMLATAYGWSESQILRTNSWRRQVYLQMVQA